MNFSKFKNWFVLYTQGMVMGVADLIPGVSGGTVAFLMGLHPRLLKGIKSLRLSALMSPKTMDWYFLSAIGLGILSSLALGAHAIYYLLNHGLFQCLLRALFMGLIAGSALFCFRLVTSWNLKRLFCLICGLMVAFTISHFSHKYCTEPQFDVPLAIDIPQSVLTEAANYDHQKKLLKNVSWSDLKALYQDELIDTGTWIFSHDKNELVQIQHCFEKNYSFKFHGKLAACGALSIGAMLLPGISGNQIMQLMGCYETIIDSIALWTSSLKNGSVINHSFWVLFSVGLGILVGLAITSRILIYFYKKYFLATLSMLIGFMIGSLPNLWPFWKVTYHIQLLKDRYRLSLQRLSPKWPSITSYETGLALAMLVLGIAIIFIFERKFAVKNLEISEV